jgi:hypothetical protein
LFCLSCWDLPSHSASHCTLGILESSQWVGVHQSGFVFFKITMQKLSNIESFCQMSQQGFSIKESHVWTLNNLGSNCTFKFILQELVGEFRQALRLSHENENYF